MTQTSQMSAAEVFLGICLRKKYSTGNPKKHTCPRPLLEVAVPFVLLSH